MSKGRLDDSSALVLVAGATADLAHHPAADSRVHLRQLRQNRRGMRFTNTSMLDVVVPKQSQWRRHLAVALSLLSLITLTAAFARPKTQIDMPRQRATVVMVIDASLSMQAKDVEPARRVGIDPQRRDARGRRADDAPPRRPNNAVNPHRRRATRCRDAGDGACGRAGVTRPWRRPRRDRSRGARPNRLIIAVRGAARTVGGHGRVAGRSPALIK